MKVKSIIFFIVLMTCIPILSYANEIEEDIEVEEQAEEELNKDNHTI